MKHLLFSILSILSSASILFSQNRAECILGDTLQLNLNNARGFVFWEESEDSLSWNFSLDSSSNYILQPSAQEKWVRAKIEEENCPTYYESPFRIVAIDTTEANYTRSSLSVSQIDGQIISAAEDQIIMELNSADFGFHAGDYLYGISGQEYLISIDAFILHQSLLYLFLSETSIPVYSIPLNFGSLISTKVRGYVLNEKGSGIFGAKVKIGNDSVYTDAKGVFQFNSVQVHEGYDFVKITKPTYFDGFKGFIPKEAGNELIISMLPETSVGFFSSAAGAVVEFNNYQVDFPANAFTLNGNPYSGFVSVRMQELNPDSSNFRQSMPGALIGNYFGDYKSLLSLGMFSIELRTNIGQKLEIADGLTVNVSYTLNPEMVQSAPDSIDLWSFDESNGYWVCEGIATKVDNKYVAAFSHFSFWNYDFPFPPAYLHGLVFNSSGEPFSGATVQIISNQLQSGYDITNSSGAFGGMVPKNMEFTVQAFYYTGDGYQQVSDVIVIPPILSDTFYIVINPPPQAEVMNQVIGTAVDCDLVPLTDAYVIHNGNISYLNDGSFSFYTTSPLDSFKLVSANPTVIGQWNMITINEGINDAGSIQLLQW
ncbi:MAG: carboxypeptidase-like regulatory domain-containing protein [Bacteroidia bacterium]